METKIIIKAQETAGKIFASIAAKIREATRAARDFIKARPSIAGVAAAARNLASVVAGPVVRGFKRAGSAALKFAKELMTVKGFARIVGGALKGLLTGGLVGIVGVAAMAGRALGAMRESLERTEESAGGAGAAATETAEDFNQAAVKTAQAAEAAKVAFGAFGDVGTGFIQRAGSVTEAVTKQAQDAAAAAAIAKDALDDTAAGLGEGTTAASRFGSALDRIGAAFTKAKDKVMAAIAKAITPALEALADMMESPEFQAFVDLLAKDLADAAVKVAAWIVNTAIPAIAAFIDEVNKAGGPIEWIKSKWEDLKNTVIRVIAIVIGLTALWARKLKEFFDGIKTKATEVWDFVKEAAIGFGTAVLAAAETAFQNVANVVITRINRVLAKLNEFIGYVNGMLETAGIKITVPKIPYLDALAAGGIVTRPTMALMGERGPEAVVPLDRMGEFMRQGQGESKVEINVTVPPNTPNPVAFGQRVGSSIVGELRRRGQSLPALG
jgi:hypothetical protein